MKKWSTKILSVLLVVSMLTSMISVSAVGEVDNGEILANDIPIDVNLEDRKDDEGPQEFEPEMVEEPNNGTEEETADGDGETHLLLAEETPSATIIASGNGGYPNVDNITWELTSDGVLTISGFGPVYFGGWNNFDVKQVFFEGEITGIGESAFSYNPQLEVVDLPDSVTEIEKNAFCECPNLVLTELPSSLIKIGEQAFAYCSILALTELPSGLTEIGASAFDGCQNLALTELPSGLTKIGPSAFYNCPNLALTELPSGLTEIGAGAFYNCPNLALTELPSGLTDIPDYAFAGCVNIALTKLPDGVTKIGKDAFHNCVNITLTKLPDGVTELGEGAFNNCKKLSLTALPSGLTKIPYAAFYWCKNISITELPTGVTEIGDWAFRQSGIALTELPRSVTNVGARAFEGCGWPVTTQHYVQDVDGDYRLEKSTVCRYVNGYTANAQLERFEHYHKAPNENDLLSIEMPEYIRYGETLILKCYYDLDTNTVVLDDGIGDDAITQNIPYGGTLVVPEDPVRPGYNFVGWVDAEGNEFDFAEPIIGPITLTAAWEARNDTPYQVQHYVQSLATRSGYILREEENLTAETDSTVTASAKMYTGFHEDPDHANRKGAGTVAGDGSLTLALYYDRDTITVTINSGDGEPSIQEVPYGGMVVEPDPPSKPGYDFGGWKDEKGQKYDFAAPVTEEITLTPIWTAKGDTPYHVEHYFQTVAGDGYVLQDTEDLTAATDSLVEAIAKTYAGFHVAENPDRVTSGIVDANGSLVLKVYYDRDLFQVVIDAGNGAEPQTQEVRYGDHIIMPEDPSKPGYIFSGWKDETGAAYDFDAPVYGGVHIYAGWSAISRPVIPSEDEEDLEEAETPLSEFPDLDDKQLTRAEAALFFANWMNASVDELEVTTAFDDVNAETEYALFITWADNAKVEIGYGGRQFGPTDALTREQLALMLYRVYGNGDRADLSHFEDSESVSWWAYDAVCWAVSKDILPALEDGTLRPQDGVTGREMAMQLRKAAELSEGQGA